MSATGWIVLAGSALLGLAFHLAAIHPVLMVVVQGAIFGVCVRLADHYARLKQCQECEAERQEVA